MITLTPQAAREVKRLQRIASKPHSLLRLTVAEGGCAGYYYVLTLIEKLETSDRHYESQGLEIAIDPLSDPYLQQLTVDYSEDLMGGSFRFHNPQATTTCNCGHSFTPQKN